MPISITTSPGILSSGLHGLNQSHQLLAQSSERLATGLSINRGSDNPSGLIASEHLGSRLESIDSETRSLGRANLDLNIEAQSASIERQAEIGMEQRANESMQRSLEEEAVNVARARSSIRDTDYAYEVSQSVRASILGKASIRVLQIGQEQSKRVLDLLG